jgi:hypothetical protein
MVVGDPTLQVHDLPSEQPDGNDALQLAIVCHRWRLVDALLRRPDVAPPDAPLDRDAFVECFGAAERQRWVDAFLAGDFAARRAGEFADAMPAWRRQQALAALTASALPLDERRRRIAWLFHDAAAMTDGFGPSAGKRPEVLDLVAWLPREAWRPMLKAIGVTTRSSRRFTTRPRRAAMRGWRWCSRELGGTTVPRRKSGRCWPRRAAIGERSGSDLVKARLWGCRTSASSSFTLSPGGIRRAALPDHVLRVERHREPRDTTSLLSSWVN